MATACIRRYASNHCLATKADVITFRTPAIYTDLKLLGVKLQALSLAVHRSPELTPEVFDSLWEACLLRLRGGDAKRALQRLICETLPSFRTRSLKGMDAAAMLVHLVAVASLNFGTFRRSGNQATLKYGGRIWGFDQNWVECREPFRYPLKFAVRDVIYAPLGGLGTQARISTSGLYRHMVNRMPEDAQAIDYVFSAATALGEDAQEALCSAFDIDTVRDSDRGDFLPFERAFNLIDRTNTCPLARLREILAPAVGERRFSVTFPETAGRKRYSHAARQRYRMRVVELQTKLTRHLRPTPVGSLSPEAASILKLQGLL